MYNTAAGSEPAEIVMDLTTSAQPNRPRSGITRVERALAEGLVSNGVNIRFVVWNQSYRRFREVPTNVALSDQLIAYSLLNYGSAPPHERFDPGSPFLVCGSGWMQNEIYAEMLAYFAGHHRLELTLMIHDLTPIMFPFWFAEGYSRKFSSDFDIVTSAASRILVYSNSTRADLQKVALERNIDIGTIGKFRLFDDIAVTDSRAIFRNPNKQAKISERFANVPFVLNVGAIHPRKNHRLLYDVWSRLVAKMGSASPHLLIIGGVAWNGNDLARTIREDVRVNSYIHILEDVDDVDLEWLFRSCVFTVYPSLYEGWGLPVAESLAFGKICLASNTSSVPEIAPAVTDLLDPIDVPGWLTRILFYAKSRSARETREAAIRAGYKLTTRRDSATEIVNALTAPARTTRRFAYALGQPVLSGRPDEAVKTRFGGWYPTERWGSWAAETIATLRLQFSRPPARGLLFVGEVRMLAKPTNARVCDLRVGGKGIARWIFDNDTACVRVAYIPAALASVDQLEIQFEVDSLQRVAPFYEVNDTRSVGIALGRFTLMAADSGVEVDSVIEAYGPKSTTTDITVVPGRPLRLSDLCGTEEFFPGIKPALLPPWGAICENGNLTLHLPFLARQPYLGSPEPLTIAFRVRAVATKAKPLSVLVVSNGEQVGVWRFEDDEVVVREIHLPVEIRYAVHPLCLEFRSHPVFSPKDLGLGAEERKFSLGILELSCNFGPQRRVAPKAYAVYELGRVIDFRAEPKSGTMSSEPYLDGGWYSPEDHGRWAIGSEARLVFKLLGRASPTLVALIEGSMFSELEQNDSIRILLNGTELGLYSLPRLRYGLGIFDLGVDAAGQEELYLTLRSSASASPFSLGISHDERRLGFSLRTIALRDLPAPTLPACLNFRSGQETEYLIMSNWYPFESDGTVEWCWTRGVSGAIHFRVPEDTVGGLDLVAFIGVSIASPERPKTVEILVNGLAVAQCVLTSAQREIAVVPIAADIAAASSILELRLIQQGPFRPSEIEGGSDTRLLGLQLFEIGLWPMGTYIKEPEVNDEAANGEPEKSPTSDFGESASRPVELQNAGRNRRGAGRRGSPAHPTAMFRPAS